MSSPVMMSKLTWAMSSSDNIDYTFKVLYLTHVTLGFVADDLYCRRRLQQRDVHRALADNRPAGLSL